MGISPAVDDYGRRLSDIFGHILNTVHCMEDLVIYSRTYKEHINLLRMLLKRPTTTTCRSTKTRRFSPSPQLFSPAMKFQQTDSGLTQNSNEPSEISHGQQISPIFVPFTGYVNKWEISAIQDRRSFCPLITPFKETYHL
jgi:hypothetical protein